MTAAHRPKTIDDVNVDYGRIAPGEERDALEIETLSAKRDAGDLADEDFRPLRLRIGIYGIRGSDRLHMVRVKIPQGVLTPTQLRYLAKTSGGLSRGWGHITTRQNIQFHNVAIEDVPEAIRIIGASGLTTREACGNTVRNVVADHMAGVGLDQVFDVTPWGKVLTDHFLRSDLTQDLPRKFKISLSGNHLDQGQGQINDIGYIATRNGQGELGFKILLGGGLGTTPFEAQVLEPFTPLDAAITTAEAVVRVFNEGGERINRNRARFKWLIQKVGIQEIRRRVFAQRDVLAQTTLPYAIPLEIVEAGAHLPLQVIPSPPIDFEANPELGRFAKTNIVPTADGKYAVYVTTPLGDITTQQFLDLANLVEDFGVDEPLDLRITNRQNIVLRGVEAYNVEPLWGALKYMDLGDPDAHSAGNVVSCPGADTCNLALTQSRGLAKAIREHLEEVELSTEQVTINASGCSNSCGQHHLGDIGLYGMERRHQGDGASYPGYNLVVGGGLFDDGVSFGVRIGRVPAKVAPKAVGALIDAWHEGRETGEPFNHWARRTTRETFEEIVSTFDKVGTIDEEPDQYVDWGETDPYKVELGQGECA